jgi:hypothetical protein
MEAEYFSTAPKDFIKASIDQSNSYKFYKSIISEKTNTSAGPENDLLTLQEYFHDIIIESISLELSDNALLQQYFALLAMIFSILLILAVWMI